MLSTPRLGGDFSGRHLTSLVLSDDELQNSRVRATPLSAGPSAHLAQCRAHHCTSQVMLPRRSLYQRDTTARIWEPSTRWQPLIPQVKSREQKGLNSSRGRWPTMWTDPSSAPTEKEGLLATDIPYITAVRFQSTVTPVPLVKLLTSVYDGVA